MALSINPVNWFEIPVNDLGRATKFYESIFGIQLSLQHPYMQVDEVGTSLVDSPMEMAWFPMQRGAPNAAGTLMKSKGYTPSHQGTQIYFQSMTSKMYLEEWIKTAARHSRTGQASASTVLLRCLKIRKGIESSLTEIRAARNVARSASCTLCVV